jgi:hypothetical protein
MLRLFNTGVREETRILEELRAIGAEVHDVDPVTKKQYVFGSFGGHFSGSCDAVARGLPEAPASWAIVEMKTHSAKSFADLSKKGVKEAKPLHYAQMQMYMGLSGGVNRALYFAVNKDTDDLHCEWIHFDQEFYDAHMAKAERVIKAESQPVRISNDPSWYMCKFCNHYDACHKDVIAPKSCRTCAYATPNTETGKWECGRFGRALSVAEQRTGCRGHLYIPTLIQFADPIDSTMESVTYRVKGSDVIFANVTHDADVSEDAMSNAVTACYTSDELQGRTKEVIGNEVIDFAKKELGGILNGK